MMHNYAKIHPVKRLFIDLLMGGIFLLLAAFALWLIWLTFFRGIYDTSFAERAVDQTEMQRIALGVGVGNEHFHNLDAAVLAGAESTSLCLKCHGNYPHSKAPDVRAFLNAHAFFTACEVCHVRPGEEDQMAYKWLDNKTGLELQMLKGKPGNYGGMIVPIKIENGVARRLDESTDKAFIEQYMELRATFNADQQAETKVRIHKEISTKPIFCNECHDKDGILDFVKLKYSPVMVNRLESGEVVTMITKYEKFYLPTMFDPETRFRDRQLKDGAK
jgi:hypothetical protein